jgi:hypothetical protein
MTTRLIRQLWKLIDATQTAFLLKLDDPTLVQWLVQQLREQQCLSQEEEVAAKAYIQSRLLLIREIA